MTTQTLWPATVVEDLHARFFTEAAEQTGTPTSNDYINGTLHDAYRKKLFQIYGTIPDGVPLAELPDCTAWAGLHLRDLLASPPYPGFRDSLKLNAPLAVQIEARPGFFPFNKFSSPRSPSPLPTRLRWSAAGTTRASD